MHDRLISEAITLWRTLSNHIYRSNRFLSTKIKPQRGQQFLRVERMARRRYHRRLIAAGREDRATAEAFGWI